MSKTILIIDDDNEIHHMLRILLGQQGYTTISAYSGTKGILVHGRILKLTSKGYLKNFTPLISPGPRAAQDWGLPSQSSSPKCLAGRFQGSMTKNVSR